MRLKINPIWHKLLFTALLFALFSNTSAQDIVVKGKVTDGESGEPLPGVNVVLDRTQIGTITNYEGLYEISVPSDQATLNFSFVGYLSESVDIAGETVVDMQLIPDIQALDEVVVIGYGTMKRKDLTGSVTSLSTEDIQTNKSSNALQALQGRVAGLDVTVTDGQAGSRVNMTLRGIRSLTASNDPLIIVDGIEYGSTLDINTSDIESIDVLKDIASTAIYGTRGANGIIMITTKRGTKDKINVSYSNYFSYNTTNYKPKIMNGEQYQQKQYEIEIANAEHQLWKDQNVTYNNETGEVTWDENANPEPWNVFGTVALDDLIAERGVADKYELLTADPTALELMRNGVSLDYLDMIMVNSWSQNHEFSVSGGTEKSALYLSLGYLNDKGLLRRDNLNRYNIKAGGDLDVNKSLRIGANILYTYKKHQKRKSEIFTRAVSCGPIGTLYNEDGTYNSLPDPVFAYNQVNPMLDEVPGAQVNDVFTNRILGSSYIDWKIIEGLSFRSSLGVNINLEENGEFDAENSLEAQAFKVHRARMTNENDKSYTWNNILTYKKTFGIHDLQLMAGSETYKNVWTEYQMTGFDQPLASTLYYDFNGITQENRVFYSNIKEKQMVSFFGRANYSLLNRYLFQATLRGDGASQLDENHRWEMFPSVSAGWRISEEGFMKNISFISNLKLRYSWGIAGNAAVAPYSSQTSLSDELSYYTFGETVYTQYLPLKVGNKTLTWETTKGHNVGLDLGVLNNRIQVNIDYYNSLTEKLLFKVPMPYVNVFPEIVDNVASIKNQGLEIELHSVIMNKKHFNWNVDLNLARNKGEVVELREGADSWPQPYGSDKIWEVGKPADAYYIYENDGIYQIQDLQAELQYISQQNAIGDSIERGRIPMVSNFYEPGDIKLIDQNGDGVFDEDDRIIKDASPSLVFGIGTNLSLNTKLGEFGLRIFAIGRYGQTIEFALNNIPNSDNSGNGFQVEAWTPQNTDTKFPRNSGYGNNRSNIHMSSLKFVDGTYIKIKDITLSYTLPEKWVSAARINNLQFYVTAKNMFVFSKLKDYDPERRGGYSFPLQRNVIFGLNLNF